MPQTNLEWEWLELPGQTGMMRRFKLPQEALEPPQSEAEIQPEAPTLKPIGRLTREQALQIPHYREKWWDLVLQTEPLEQGQVQQTISAAYNLLNLGQPIIQFFGSPHAALPAIASQLEYIITQKWTHDRNLSRFDLGERLVSQLSWWLESDLKQQVWERFQVERSQHLWAPVWQPLEQELWQRLAPLLPEKENDFYFASRFHEAKQQELQQWITTYCQPPETWTATAGFLDFCISTLHCHPNPDFWQAYQRLIQTSSWLFPFRDTCIICDRPTAVHLNDHYQLHAIGQPAVQFADGQAIEVCYGHGVKLPEEYRSVPPEQWQIAWLDQEADPVLRQVLIAGICEAHGIDVTPNIRTAIDLQRLIHKE